VCNFEELVKTVLVEKFTAQWARAATWSSGAQVASIEEFLLMVLSPWRPSLAQPTDGYRNKECTAREKAGSKKKRGYAPWLAWLEDSCDLLLSEAADPALPF
jgi:hypothetical protein